MRTQETRQIVSAFSTGITPPTPTVQSSPGEVAAEGESTTGARDRTPDASWARLRRTQRVLLIVFWRVLHGHALRLVVIDP